MTTPLPPVRRSSPTARRPDGFMLIVCLLLASLLLIMGIAFLSQRASQYQGAVSAASSAQARSLAEAGMEDARAKLRNDLRAIPPAGHTFVYQELVYDVDGVTSLGTYSVTIDSTWNLPPYSLVEVTSISHTFQKVSSHGIRAELDTAPLRGSPPSPNPNYFKLINWQDFGDL